MGALRIDLADEAATVRLAAALALRARAGDVIALGGDLGTGKTALARAFIRALCGADEEVPSPTFTLAQFYDAPAATVWHFDLYRLDQAEEALELGIEDAFAEGITLVEWPERLGRLLPPRRLDVTLARGRTADQRVATLQPHGDWAGRLEGLQGEI